MDEPRLRELRNTAWTEAGYVYWQSDDPPETKREVWNMHQRTGLDQELGPDC